jgi:hypothetical protein
MAGLIINAQFTTPANWSIAASPSTLSTEITALGKETNLIADWAKGLQQPSPASASLTSQRVGEEQSLDARVFNALAEAKILTSRVAMHIDREVRNRFFRQLDSLHDIDEWEEGDKPVNQSSFQTFLKAILSIRPEQPPGLGMSHTGNLIAAWMTARDRLTIEFLPNDRVRWVLARYRDDEEPARFAGQTKVSELIEGLAPHRPEHWFSNASENREPSG